MRNTSTVNVQPGDFDLLVANGETLIEAAWRQGYYWPTVCGGKAECRACWLRVLAGSRHTEPPEPEEVSQLRRLTTDDDEDVRLACRLRTNGPVVVLKKGVRRRRT